MTATETPGFTGYILGNSSAEYKRLHRQALLWEKITKRVFTEAGLTAGMHCFEAGCGTGDIMRLAGDIAGVAGSVTGIDIDEKLGIETMNILSQLHNSNYFFRNADLVHTELPAAQYDFVYCRFFLIHVTDPKAMIKKLYSAVKPGGILLVQDYDFAAFKVNDELKDITGFVRYTQLEIFKKTGKDPEAGTNICRYFIETGLGKPAGTDAASIITPAADAMLMMKDVMQNMKPVMLQLGITTEERIQQFYREADDFIEREKNYYVVWPMMNSAWVRKPLN